LSEVRVVNPRKPAKRRPSPPRRRPIRAAQVARINVYAAVHGFDVPDLTGWSTAIGESFYRQMTIMVRDDIWTDDE